MKSKGMLTIVVGFLGAMIALGQQAPAPQSGPGVQAPSDAKYAEFVAKNCKNPPPARGAGGGRGPGAGANATPQAPTPQDYTITEIPGVIAAGQKWKSAWKGTGNNADGI